MRIPPVTFPLVIDTLGTLLATGTELSAHCCNHGCNHFGYLNRVALARRLGIDHSTMADDLRPHVFCPACRKAGRPDRNIGFTGHALTDPHTDLPPGHPAMQRD